MRIAAWLSIAFAVISAIAVFMPGLELRIAGLSTKSTSVSLWNAALDRDKPRRMIEVYQGLHGRQLGAKILKHVGNRAHADDARDAMETLDEVDPEDVRKAGYALVGLAFGYLALIAGFFALASGAVREHVTASKRRVIATAVVALLAAAVAIAVRVAWGMVLGEAEEEIGKTSLQIGFGAFLMPVGACGAFAASVAVAVLRLRDGAQRDAKPA